MNRRILALTAMFIVTVGFSYSQTPIAHSIEKETQELVLEPIEIGGGIPLMEALKSRKSVRQFHAHEIDNRIIGQLLWAANGVNRSEDNKRTAPSARNAQEINVYVFHQSGIYLYLPENHQVKLIRKGDHRHSVSKADFTREAPLFLVLVADYNKMSKFEDADKEYYSAIDCGYVSQNIYLYCASEHLSTVAMGNIEKNNIAKLIGLKNGKVLLGHPISLE